MAKFELVNKLTKTMHRAGFKLQKHSPEILAVVGVVGTVASAVMACKATTKVSAIMEETKETIETIHECSSNPEYAEKYTAEDSKKDLAIVYAQTGLKFAKLYAPAVALGVVSIGCMLTSNNILRKRNMALAAAYTAVDKGFKDYRKRVVDRFGKELDRELLYNIKAKQIEEKVVDEKGKEKTVKKTVHVTDGELASPYARFYDDGCMGWEKDSEYNLMFLHHQQQYFNDLLESNGHVFLNEVYDSLGIPRTRAGNIVGWLSKDNKNSVDGYIDFGIFNVDRPKSRDFVNGYEKVILLDFNVDGEIIDLI